MTTVADMVSETRQHFLGGLRERKDKLAAGLTASLTDTTVTVTYDAAPIGIGSVLTIGIERMLVWTEPNSSKQVTVERAWDGTSVATHAIGDIVSVNSRCDDFAIFRALKNVLGSLSSPRRGLFRVRSLDLTYNASTYGYDMASSGTVIGTPLSVSAEGNGSGEWVPLPSDDWRYEANADLTDFASGRAVFTTTGVSGRRLRVLYRAPFVLPTLLTDDVQNTVFLPSSANDIPPMGAALQLAAGRPMRRADVDGQGSTRRAEETSTQDTLIATTGLRTTYEERIADEAARMASDFPTAL